MREKTLKYRPFNDYPKFLRARLAYIFSLMVPPL